VDAGRQDGVIEQLMSSAPLNGDGRYLASFAVNVQNVNTAARQPLPASLDRIGWTILAEAASDEQPLIELHWLSGTDHCRDGQEQHQDADEERAHRPNENWTKFRY